MRHDIKLISMFVALEISAFIIFEIYALTDIILASALGTLAAALISNRKNTRQLDCRGPAKATFVCAGILATLFSVIFNARLYLALIFVGITGSPFDVPAVNLLKVFVQCWVIVFASASFVIFIYDSQGLKAPPEAE
jgi:hypothetical protein